VQGTGLIKSDGQTIYFMKAPTGVFLLSQGSNDQNQPSTTTTLMPKTSDGSVGLSASNLLMQRIENAKI